MHVELIRRWSTHEGALSPISKGKGEGLGGIDLLSLVDLEGTPKEGGQEEAGMSGRIHSFLSQAGKMALVREGRG